eukprot:8727143-Pyramimonas_sp.AAC.1
MLSAYCETFETWFQEQGWSGSAQEYANGAEDLVFTGSDDCVGSWNLLTSKGGEIKLSHLNPEEREQFRASDGAEWEVSNRPGVLRVLSLAESQHVIRTKPDRVLSSRMVRRWKNQEGTFSAKMAKSIWCVHGFRDPDTEQLITYSQTPQSESMMLFAAVLLSCDMDQAIVDCKNAF